MRILKSSSFKEETVSLRDFCSGVLTSVRASRKDQLFKIVKDFCYKFFNINYEMSYEELSLHIKKLHVDKVFTQEAKDRIINILHRMVIEKYAKEEANIRELKDEFILFLGLIKENLDSVGVRDLSIIRRLALSYKARRAEVFLARINHFIEMKNYDKAKKLFSRLKKMREELKPFMEKNYKGRFEKEYCEVAHRLHTSID